MQGKKAQVSHNFIKMAYLYISLYGTESKFHKEVLSDFFWILPFGLIDTLFRGETNAFCFFLSPLPLSFSFLQPFFSHYVTVFFTVICACAPSGTNARTRSHLTARFRLIRSHSCVSVRKAVALRFIRLFTARSAATASPGIRTFLFFYDFMRHR